jgi:dTDP-4-amino-4,6-dideoxygalactose transaminase
VLRSGRVNYWTGTEVKNFEAEYAAHCGCRYAIALANGTLALELALYALNIGPGDEVIVPSRTFIASASAAVMRGARPVVVDIDPQTATISPESVASHITPKTKAIIPVHLSGHPCDMDALLNIARSHKLFIIEDCAQAHGARYKGQPLGGLGEIGAFSFCQDKIITTGGEGGMLVTNSREVWEKAWSYKDHGKSVDSIVSQAPVGGFRWRHNSFGTNWRLTEMQAALGRVSLRYLEQWVTIRRRNAAIIREGFAGISGIWAPTPTNDFFHSYYKFDAYVRPETLAKGWSRELIVQAILAEGIPCSAGGASEIYLEHAFQNAGLTPVHRFPNAQKSGETSLVFMVHPTLTERDINDLVHATRKVMSIATTSPRA